MQGVPLEPLLLLTQEEVERHEAASAVQAASRSKAERQSKGSVQEQLEARRRAEEEAALRGQEASLEAARPKGPSLAEMSAEVGGDVGGYRHAETIARDPPDAQALGGWRLPLRLGAEQVARLVARQAIELDILGLPPAVSTE